LIDLGKAAVDRILGFLGYGNPRASLWFIGLEEGLGEMNDSDIVANLSARGRFSEVMDLSDAHLSLLEGGRPYDLSQRQKFTQVWLWMGRLARAIEGALAACRTEFTSWVVGAERRPRWRRLTRLAEAPLLHDD